MIVLGKTVTENQSFLPRFSRFARLIGKPFERWRTTVNKKPYLAKFGEYSSIDRCSTSVRSLGVALRLSVIQRSGEPSGISGSGATTLLGRVATHVSFWYIRLRLAIRVNVRSCARSTAPICQARRLLERPSLCGVAKPIWRC
jgi:hypothetical protein